MCVRGRVESRVAMMSRKQLSVSSEIKKINNMTRYTSQTHIRSEHLDDSYLSVDLLCDAVIH